MSGARCGANVEPGGTEWGRAPPKIEQTTTDAQTIHRFGRGQASEGDGSLATGRRRGH